MKNILVTGASTGIGYYTAKAFLEKGYKVWGSVRKESDAERLKADFGEHFEVLMFDVTDHDAVQAAAMEMEKKIGKTGLACLVNNAGIATTGPLMEQSMEDLRWQFEVNVFGLMAVTQAFLPLLGAKRNPGHAPGRIMNVSSVAGKFSAPFLGAYAGSKHAVEGLSHSLRRELQLYGIDVIIIGPGAVRTPIWEKSGAYGESAERYKHTDYYQQTVKFSRYAAKNGENGLDANEFGEKMVQIFEKRKPKTRYAIVPRRFKDWILPTMMPDRAIDKALAKRFDLNPDALNKQ